MKIAKILLRLLVFLMIAGFAGGITFVCLTVAQAPDLSEVDVKPEGYLTTVLDQDGDTMVTLAGVEANRVYVDLDQIPQDVQDAFVAIEDSRFWTHHGIDLRGIARAFVKGVANGFHFSEGASTITQQLLKNNVFTDWTEESSFLDRVSRKIQEQYLALKLEQRDTKEMILENYLNTINLGGGTWGVEAASKRYFGKDVSELTLSESALIAGITKNPSAYNPLNDEDACRERQKLVLEAMLDQGYITEDEYQEALDDDVFTRIEENHTDVNAEVLSYFEDALVEQVLSDLEQQLGYTEEEAWEAIYRGGLTIYSTQNSELQKIAEEEVNDDEHYDSDAQVSLVMTDVDSGAVVALVGGRGEKTASLILNRATDSQRQPGSTIKIVGEYAAALDSGTLTLGSVMDDAPYAYSNGTEISDADGEYRGMTTVRTSIVKSLNITALKTFQTVGMDAVWKELSDFGITTLTDEDKVEALALGGTSGGVTNWEMTAAYNAIANGGEYIAPYLYTKVVDHDGNTILENERSCRQVIRSETAALLTNAMEDVMTEGTGTKAYFEGAAVAGKSGTTTSFRDVWFIGYDTDVTCGIWGGFDDDRTQDNGNYVKYLWKAVMQRAAEATGAGTSFASENELVSAEICTKCGLLAEDGLCDDTVQGDMTRTEYYAPGSAPTAYCDCHEAVEICSDSGQLCSSFCPTSSRIRKVYLKSGTEGTEDEDYVVPDSDGTTCQTHTHIWNWFGIGGNSQDGGSTDGDGGAYGDGSTDGSGTYGDGSTDGSGTYGDGSTDGNGGTYGDGSADGNGGAYGDGSSDGSGGSYGEDHGDSDDGAGSWWDSFTDWLR